MTAKDFIRRLCEMAKERGRPCIAIDFEQAGDSIAITFRFKEES